MDPLVFSVEINAPKDKVWHAMLDDVPYREWTGAFHPGSYYEGSWEKGASINFVSDEEDGKSGLAGMIAENIPDEYISIEYIGDIVKGEIDTESEDAKQWIGAHENYTFKEADGVTTVVVELISENIHEDMVDMFKGMWPPALQKLKEIAERA